MITHSRIAQFLRSLASETTAENLRTNYLLMGEAIQTVFQSTSPFWTEYESLGKRIKGGEDSPPIEDTLRDFKLLAAAANRYLNQIGPQLSVTAGDRNQQEITQLVDQAFYKSQPFHFAKWITIAGLIFIGAGSGTFAGFSLNLWDRTKEAQQKLDDADRKSDQIMKKIATDVEELEKKQQDAFEATQRAIQQKNAQYDAMVKDELDKARQVFDQNVTAASTIIEQQKNKVVSDVGAADSFIEAKKGEVSATVSTTSDAVKDLKDGFGKGLDLLLEQAKAKVASAIADQTAVIVKVAENGTQKIGEETQKKLDSLARTAQTDEDSLNNVTAKKRTEIDDLAGRNATTLHDALNGKLSDLNGKSSEAAKSIDGIVTAMTARESDFVNKMNSRLSDWDQRVALELKRNEDIAKTVADIGKKTKDLGDQLEALQNSSAAALEVAQQLRTGTKTGELPIIGKVLERSAFLFVLTLIIAAVGALLAGCNLFVTILRKPIPDGPRPPVAPF